LIFHPVEEVRPCGERVYECATFKNPLLAAIERVLRREIPSSSKTHERTELGLSSSLQEGRGRKLRRGQEGGGSRDDLGVVGAVPEIETLLDRMWRGKGAVASQE